MLVALNSCKNRSDLAKICTIGKGIMTMSLMSSSLHRNQTDNAKPYYAEMYERLLRVLI